MKLEREAKEHLDSKLKVFNEGLQDHFTWVEEYLDANLWGTTELDVVKQNLTTALLWARRSADTHGIK